MEIFEKLTREQIQKVIIEFYNDRDKWADTDVREVIRHIKEQILSLTIK
jgi:hypothetical protein